MDQMAPPQAQIPQGNEQVNVFNPEGQLVSIPASQAGDAGSMGYIPASPEDVHQYQIQEKYGTPTETAKTFLEGASKGASFGLSTGLEKAVGVKPEDIRGRAEANPVASQLGEIGGLAGSALIPGAGEANILRAAGEGAAGLAGLEGAGALAKIGSAAVRGAVETAMVQGGDEVSKMFMQDPNQTAQTAIVNIGLSGLLGAGIGGTIGTVSPLWEATVGKKFGNFLEAIQKRTNGEAIGLPAELGDALDRSAMQVAPEIRSALSGNPEIQNQWARLQESLSQPGLDAQKSLAEFRKSASDNLVSALGKSPDEIPNLADVSDHEVGKKFQDQITKFIDERYEPIKKQYDAFNDTFKGTGFNDMDKAFLQEKLGNIINQERFHIYKDTPQAKLAYNILESVPKLQTMEDLNKAISIINDQTKGFANSGMWNIGKQLKSAIEETQDMVGENILSTKAPETLQAYRNTRAAYKALRQDIDELNGRLHFGSYGGPKGAMEAIKDMNPEVIAKRLNPKTDVGLMDFLSKNMPEVAQGVKDYQLNKLLGSAAIKAAPDHPINAKTLFSALDKMSPEMRQFVLPEGAEARIGGTRALLEALPQKLNPSGTAKTLDSLWSKLPGSAVALASMMTGHNPAIGFLLGQSAKWIGRDAPDAIRLGFLKFLGHSGPVEPTAFKSMVDYAVATAKGESLLSKGTKALFQSGQDVLPRNKLPSEKEKSQLDKKLQSLKQDPMPLMNTGGKTSYYLPEHGSAMGQTASQAVNFLNNLRPNEDKLGPLDPKRVPSKMEQTKYDNALSIAQQPMVVLQKLKDKTLTPDDLLTLKTIYPNLYERMSQKIVEHVTDVSAKGESIPYQTRLGLSLFLGQPLDSTMTSQAIQMNQPQAAPAPQGQPQEGQKMVAGGKSLTKLPASYLTQQQARAQARAAKG